MKSDINNSLMKWLRKTLLLLFFCLNLTISYFAEVLPVKTYTTADGLLRDANYKIIQDSRGFLWFVAEGGISRFDGYVFTNYTMDDGLPAPNINDLIEASDGTIWVTSNEGLIKFNPRGLRQKFDKNNPTNPDSIFQVFPLSENNTDKRLYSIIEFEKDLFYAANPKGVFKIEIKDGVPYFYPTEITANTLSLMKDRQGNLWVGTWREGLLLMSPDGKISSFTDKEGLPEQRKNSVIEMNTLFEDKDGRIWLGGRGDNGGICRLVENPQPNQKITENCYTTEDGLSANWVYSFSQTHDGIIWVSTNFRLTQLRNFSEKGKPNFRILDNSDGLSDKEIYSILEDRDGNIWIATMDGVRKIVKQGFTRFERQDGLLSNGNFSSIFEKTNGELVVTAHHYQRNIYVFRDEKFVEVKPNYTKEIDYLGWGGKHAILQTRDGEWWVIAGSSAEFQKKYGMKTPKAPFLVRFPAVEKVEDLAKTTPRIYHTSDALNIRETYLLYEDRNDDVWMMAFGDGAFLYRWDRKTDKFIDYSDAADVGGGFFQTFAEDGAGNVWFGGAVYRKSDPNKIIKLLRYKDGQFKEIFPTEDFQGMVYDLLIDSKGSLWATTSRYGLIRTDNPNDENPNFVFYGTAQGLSDNQIYTVAEDKFGRIYAGSGRGVDRLNLATGEVKHFTTEDGLPVGDIYLSKTDRHGAVWFGSKIGLARIIPEAEKLRQPPNILISGLRVAGVSQKISELGETALPGFEFNADKNNLAIDFIGLGANLGEDLKYQYRLGDENSEWITTNERTLNFANISAGSYKFSVRAVTSDGLISPNPATFSFTILRPIYLRWWFLLLSAVVIGLVIYRLYLFRLNRLLEIERTRTRIATDLHDDIGADLSKISLLSEVVKMQMTNDNEENNRLLTKIAETSRNSVDSMRDIVWAINPSLDSINDLVKKMRQFAEETLVEKNIKLNFNAPNENQKLKLSMDTRRELYLIFKEAVNNASKYAACSEVKIDFEVIGKEISLKINDNGKGFDISQEFEGNGLKNMKQRAEKLKGTFEIDSTQGTKILVKFPQ